MRVVVGLPAEQEKSRSGVELEMNLQIEGSLAAILTPSFPPELHCFNSESFHFFLDRELAESNRYGHFSCFALFHFESSHNGELLHKFVRALSENIRNTDYLGMIDDSTVGLILQHASVENTRKVMDRLVKELKAVFPSQNGVSIRASSAVFPTEANTRASLEGLAEERLKAAELRH
mgnify:CR=1 FL=1